MHSVTTQVSTPVNTPPKNEPPIIVADSLAAESDVATLRLLQAPSVADVSLTGHWEIRLKDWFWRVMTGLVDVSSHTWSLSISVLAVTLPSLSE